MKVRTSPFVMRFVREKFGTIEKAQEEYSGMCIDFAGELQDSIPGSRLAYFEPLHNSVWRYHAAVEFGGWIHDLWFPMFPLSTFMLTIGATTVEYPADPSTLSRND